MVAFTSLFLTDRNDYGIKVFPKIPQATMIFINFFKKRLKRKGKFR